MAESSTTEEARIEVARRSDPNFVEVDPGSYNRYCHWDRDTTGSMGTTLVDGGSVIAVIAPTGAFLANMRPGDDPDRILMLAGEWREDYEPGEEEGDYYERLPTDPIMVIAFVISEHLNLPPRAEDERRRGWPLEVIRTPRFPGDQVFQVNLDYLILPEDRTTPDASANTVLIQHDPHTVHLYVEDRRVFTSYITYRQRSPSPETPRLVVSNRYDPTFGSQIEEYTTE